MADLQVIESVPVAIASAVYFVHDGSAVRSVLIITPSVVEIWGSGVAGSSEQPGCAPDDCRLLFEVGSPRLGLANEVVYAGAREEAAARRRPLR